LVQTENMKLATRKKIELKLLVPVSPMSVAYAITATDHETSALLPSPGTPGSVVSEALERVCEGDYEEGTERGTSVSLSLMESPGSLSFSSPHT
jgi:hypothetical protein